MYRLLLASLLAVSLLAGGCSGKEPFARGADPSSDIVIGLGWPVESRDEGMSMGVALAEREINEAGGLLGRKVRIEPLDDGGTVTGGMAAAHRFAANRQIVAVIGHRASKVSVPASSIYEQAGIVMLTPGSTAPKLTNAGYRYVFRMIPSDERIGARMAEYAMSRRYVRAAILYTDDEYGRGLANAFEDYGKRIGINTVDRLSGYADRNELTRIVAGWQALGAQAVFVAAAMPEAGEIVADLELAGSGLPIIGGDGLDSADLAKVAGAAADGVVAASIFDPDDPAAAGFTKRYEAAYGRTPGKWAAQGYDAVRLLAAAAESAGSAEPSRIAEALRGLKGWPGVTGVHTFDESGDIVDKPIVLKRFRTGKFDYLSGEERRAE